MVTFAVTLLTWVRAATPKMQGDCASLSGVLL